MQETELTKKKIFPTDATPEVRSTASQLPRLTLKRSEPFKDHGLDSLFSLENPDFGKFFIADGEFVNGAFLRSGVTRGSPDDALSNTERIFFSLLDLGKGKSILLGTRLFENIDARSNLDQSKY